MGRSYGIILLLLLIPGIAFAGIAHLGQTTQTAMSDLRAFPGAEGSATYASGGRGGSLYIVTNTDNSGTGSLRDAVSSSNRVIVFNVSGWIDLSSDILSTSDNITIYGQTSPGGVGVQGGTSLMFGIEADNWIVTHMRFATGETQSDSLHISGGQSTNGTAGDLIMIHQCTMRFGCDENVSNSYIPGRVTYSHCIIGPSIGTTGDTCHDKGPHNYGMLVWWFSPDESADCTRLKLTVHNSFFVHNSYRNPELQHTAADNEEPTYDIVNNVIWDFDDRWGIEVAGTAHVNVLSNWVAGADSNATPGASREVAYYYDFTAENQFFIEDNWGTYRLDDDDPIKDDWESIVRHGSSTDESTTFQASTRWATAGVPVTVVDMTSAHASVVVAAAGATKPSQDSVDTTVKADFENETKDWWGYSDRTYPSLTGSHPAGYDDDSDGMEDDWETEKFGGTGYGAFDDYDGDGYVNIEEFAHYLTQ